MGCGSNGNGMMGWDDVGMTKRDVMDDWHSFFWMNGNMDKGNHAGFFCVGISPFFGWTCSFQQETRPF